MTTNVERADTDGAIRDAFSVMRHLRDLAGPDAFLARVREQEATGYRLALLRDDGVPRAVAGYRVGLNLAWGRHLYVDDLVTDPQVRAHGHGTTLLRWLVDEARAAGCVQLHLDSGHQRVGAHRFYLRQGMEDTSRHFRILL